MPYTAVIPIILLGLRWVAQKLANVGILPLYFQKLLQIRPQSEAEVEAAKRGCCNSCDDLPKAPEKSVCVELSSSEEWDEILSSKELVITKFTADWCQPCKSIFFRLIRWNAVHVLVYGSHVPFSCTFFQVRKFNLCLKDWRHSTVQKAKIL